MIVITGSRGFIGSRLAQAYPDAIGVDKLDGHDINLMDPIPCDVLINMAAISGIKACEEDQARAMNTNALSPFFWSKSAKFSVMASSAAVHGETHYGATKRTMEELCKKSCILRFSNVYGPGSANKTSVVATMFRDALSKGVITVHGGDQLRDFVHIDDVVDAIGHFVEMREIGVFNVCSGQQTNVRAVAHEIARLTGARILETGDWQSSAKPMKPFMKPKHPDILENLQGTYEYFRSL